MIGEAVTIWTVRIALLLYLGAAFSWLVDGPPRRTRLLWTAGLVFYLAHVASAFYWIHGLSHERAALETARQTEELVGIRSAAGLWLNYLFTAVWCADAIWWWRSEGSYIQRARVIAVGIHAFLAFMFFNGAVVFAGGFSRWVGAAATPPLVFLLARRCRKGRQRGRDTTNVRSPAS
jgi:hypothetical protein